MIQTLPAKSLNFACAVLLLLEVLPTQAIGGRTAISKPLEQCAFVTRESEREFVYEHACAEALSSFNVAYLQKRCDDWELVSTAGESEPLSLLTLLQNDAVSPEMKFHAFGSGRFLLEIPCNHGAYNQTSLFFGYDESRLPATVELLEFPQAQGTPRAEIWSRGVDARRGLVVEYAKARGMGDAGRYARYALHPNPWRATLLEAIVKEEWDGEDTFQWLGNFDAKPAGRLWKRTYPAGDK